MLDPRMTPRRVLGSHATVIRHNPPAFRPAAVRRAVWFVATTHRPALLRQCLDSLLANRAPCGWSAQILVCGQPDDQGRAVAEAVGARWVDCETASVTSKLNKLLATTDAELVMLADDDDLQPASRLEAAIKAHDSGAHWSGVGSFLFYHVPEDRLIRWVGPANAGLVGTSLNFRAEELRRVGGWPETAKGKDGPLARKLSRATFRDLTEAHEPVIATQHGANMWTNRPVPAAGESARCGKFALEGLGSLEANAAMLGTQAGRIRAIRTAATPPESVCIGLVTRDPSRAFAIVQRLAELSSPRALRVAVVSCAPRADFSGVEKWVRRRGWTFERTAQPLDEGAALRWLAARAEGASLALLLGDGAELPLGFWAGAWSAWHGRADAAAPLAMASADPLTFGQCAGAWLAQDVVLCDAEIVRAKLAEDAMVAQKLDPSRPVTCAPGGMGQSAYVHGMVSALGFQAVDFATATHALGQGRHVMFHGWGHDVTRLAAQHRGRVHVLWHSGFAGSDLMGEGLTLGKAWALGKAHPGLLCFLDERDVLPAWARRVLPIWDPASLAGLATGVERQAGHVAVAFHGKYPSAAKNILAAVIGTTHAAGVRHVHLSAHATADALRGPVLRQTLEGVPHTAHPTLPRDQAMRVVAGCDVLVHPSLSDTWPYATMEAVACRTVVLGSDVLAWMHRLPEDVRDACMVSPATSTGAIASRLGALLSDTGLREHVASEQRHALDAMSGEYRTRNLTLYRELGFEVPSE